MSALCAAKDIWSHDEDTNARKKREMITETVENRQAKPRTREGGTQSGKAANESEGAEDQA